MGNFIENKWEILESIDSIVDLYEFEGCYHSASTHPASFELHNQINDELKKKGLIGEFQNIYFLFGEDGMIKDIHLQRETRNIKNPTEERFTNSDGNEVIVYRRDLIDIEKEEQSKIVFDVDEWKCYKRTKMIDNMLGWDKMK